MARAQINHASVAQPASRHAANAARVEIWVRKVKSRRQASYRCPALGQIGWRDMGVPLANAALKAGRISLPGITDATVEAYTEDAAPHPAAAGFAEQARKLNSEIDALNLAAGSAA